MKTPYNKACKGCYSFNEIKACMYSSPEISKNCPCTVCLIKGVCDHPCEEYIKSDIHTLKLRYNKEEGENDT